MSATNAKVMHFRFRGGNGVLPRGGVTVAIDEKNGRWAAAWCTPEDNYCKRLGRMIALGRLRAQNGYCHEIEPDDNTVTICAKAVMERAPEAWTRRVKRWLQKTAVRATLSCGHDYSFDLRLRPSESRRKAYMAITWEGVCAPASEEK